MKKIIVTFAGMVALSISAHASEWNVATNGNDDGVGCAPDPLRTIQHAADIAKPGDVIIVHEGVYRERVNPPRGGESDAKRIVYQAAAGEKVVVTGSEIVKGWTKERDDVWKVTIPNSFFGKFNPYSDLIHGDWFGANGRQHHTGAVYLNGDWLIEAAELDDLFNAAGSLSYQEKGGCLLNVAWFQPAKSAKIPATRYAAQNGVKNAPCTEGGECIGWIENGDWVRYDNVDFGAGADSIEIRAASVTGGGVIEIRDGSPTGDLLGTCAVADTGDWQVWQSFTAKIKPVNGSKKLCMLFRPPLSTTKSSPLWFASVDADNTTIRAQFPGVNPNEANVELNVRQTVFTPSKTGINFITVRGFELRNAATPWAPPTAAQIGIVSAYWNKGWIIESNEICYSKCCGVALGKYGDEFDNRAESAEGYVGTLTRALTNGWNKATVGSHIVRNNHIHHCDQTGIVGSLGCAFSTVTENVIHDIHHHNRFGGAEMGGIKFHGAIDVTISHNHIYRCGSVAGIWLDWMAQGARVSGNLLHDNSEDIFFEMQHGPILFDNNLVLSPRRSLAFNSQGIAVVHNLVVGPVGNSRHDKRATPFHKPHTTELAGMHADSETNDSGDHRFYNNILAPPCNLNGFDNSALPCFAAGNVFTKGTQPSKFDVEPLVKSDFDARVNLEEKSDGWYLTMKADKSWRGEAKCKTVTTDSLGKAKVPDCAFQNADGSPLRIDTDYFGKPRDEKNPTPGPFENPGDGEVTLKVW